MKVLRVITRLNVGGPARQVIPLQRGSVAKRRKVVGDAWSQVDRGLSSEQVRLLGPGLRTPA
jgi:hypothetical protein